MKYYLTVLFITFVFTQSNGQGIQKWKEGKRFSSIFQKLRSGNFQGTANGVLIIKDSKGVEQILDFQGSYGKLEIERDKEEVYDVSTKRYIGKTTSGKTEIHYETYASGNAIGIKINGQWFKLSALDGASDMVINGIEYTYKTEPSIEYLILRTSKELELTNWQYLIRTEHTVEPDNFKTLKSKLKSIKVLPESIIVFAIKRT